MLVTSLFSLATQAGGPAPGPAAPGDPMQQVCGGQGGMFVPMIMIFVIFYFMLIRPQQKKQKELQDWLKTIKRGDEVVTTGGMIGKISHLADDVVTLELQEKAKVRVLRSHIAGKAPGQPGPGPTAPEPESK